MKLDTSLIVDDWKIYRCRICNQGVFEFKMIKVGEKARVCKGFCHGRYVERHGKGVTR